MILTEENIGERFVKHDWSHCFFQLDDIGTRTVWGHIVDPNVGKIIAWVYFSRFDADWKPYGVSAEEFIRKLPIKRDKGRGYV